MNAPFIKTENLCFSYDEDDGRHINVLDNVSVEIERGSYVAVIGHNGSGKSTVAKLTNGILFPSKGKVFVDGIH